MPLNALKVQHILQVVGQTFAQRQRTLVVVYLVNGSYSYSTIQAIMRPEMAPDPTIYDVGPLSAPRGVDTLLIAPLGTNFTGAVYIADTTIPSASAVAAAPKYEIVEVLPAGIVPGGTHLRVSLRRLR